MRLSASVMAHPAREAQVGDLLAALGRDVPVAWDPKPPSLDAAQRWATGRAAWELADPDADWHLVLQDDAVPCPDLLDGLAKGLDHVPANTVVSCYFSHVRPFPARTIATGSQAERMGAAWIDSRFVWWGVALAIPVREIRAMLAMGDKRHEAYDRRIGLHFRSQRWRCWHPFPSLVDHRDDESLCGHKPGRTAYRFRTGSALNVDWGGPVVEMA
jgi:hypothetical protein